MTLTLPQETFVDSDGYVSIFKRKSAQSATLDR